MNKPSAPAYVPANSSLSGGPSAPPLSNNPNNSSKNPLFPNGMGYPPPPAGFIPSPKPFSSDQKEVQLLFGALLLGILFWEWILSPPGVGFSSMLFVIAAYGITFLYGFREPTFQPKRGWGWSIPVFLGSVCLILYSDPLLSFLNIVFVYFMAAFHIWTMFGQRGQEIFGDLGSSGFLALFCHLDAPFRTLGKITSKNEKSGKVGRIFLGLLLSVPILAFVTILLISADAAFEKAIGFLLVHFSDWTGRLLLDLFFGVFFAIFIFSWFYTVRRRTRNPLSEKKTLPKVFDSLIIGTVIWVICTLYLAFLIIQFRYLFSAVLGKLPTDYIYSSYARRGFFEMLLIAGINLFILIAALCSKERDHFLLKCASTFLAILTIILALSALSKMVMYVYAYGLTPLRVYTSWFLILEMLVFVLLILGILIPKFPTAKALFIGGIVLFLALNFICVDKRIAQYNTERYFRAPVTTEMDLSLFESLGYESVPSLLEIYKNSPNQEDVQQAEWLLISKAEQLNAMDWRAKNIAVLQAEQLLKNGSWKKVTSVNDS